MESDGCTGWPEGSWSACCVVHDAAYDNPLIPRLTADLDLAWCVAEVAGWPMALVMFAGVALFGWTYRRRALALKHD